MAKKTFKRTNYPRVSQEFYEGDTYADGVYDEDGNKVIRSLNDMEREFLDQFNNETLANNHGMSGSLHRQNLDNYEERKSEFYKDTNSRNNDLYGIAKAGNRLNDKVKEECKALFKEDKIELNLKTIGVTETVDILIEEVIDDWGDCETYSEMSDRLLDFGLVMFKIITEEKRRHTRDRKIEKETQGDKK